MAVYLDPASSILPLAGRVLVCGGRDFADEPWLFRVLDCLHRHGPIDCVIQGGAKGADALARVWARERDVLCRTFEADWAQHGRGAGPIRNQQMLDEGKPTLVVAFPGGRGTADMVRRASVAGADYMVLSKGPGTATVGAATTVGYPAIKAVLRASRAASGILTEGGDAKQAPGESLSSPAPKGDAQP